MTESILNYNLHEGEPLKIRRTLQLEFCPNRHPKVSWKTIKRIFSMFILRFRLFLVNNFSLTKSHSSITKNILKWSQSTSRPLPTIHLCNSINSIEGSTEASFNFLKVQKFILIWTHNGTAKNTGWIRDASGLEKTNTRKVSKLSSISFCKD